MKIKDVRATVHRLPIYLPGIAEPTEHRHHVFCEVETDEGHVGHGMTARFLTRAVANVLVNDVRPAVRDLDPRDFEAVHDRLGRVVSERGLMTGVNLAAVSCLDIALWDLMGKAAGRTVAQLLGGHRDFATVYLTYGFGNYDREQLAELALEQIAAGHRRLKMLVGVPGLGWREDAARVRHVRDAIGDTVDLALDANESYSASDALQLCRAVEDCGIAWLEDPVHNNDVRPPAPPAPAHRDPARRGADGGSCGPVSPIPGERRDRHPAAQPDVQRRGDPRPAGSPAWRRSTRSRCPTPAAPPISACTTWPGSATGPMWSATSSPGSWRRTSSSGRRSRATGRFGSPMRRGSGSPSTATC